MKTLHVFLIFIAIVLIQLFVPAKMIFDREAILESGTVYKFKTRPVDPSDPFRGKYVILNYELNTAQTQDSTFKRNQNVLLYLKKDSLGYAEAHSLSKHENETGKDFIEVNVNSYNKSTNMVRFNLPFNRYYMEEFKAKPAEDIYRKYNRQNDSIFQTYALVAIKDGKAVLKDVYINDKSIHHYIKKEANQ